MTEKPSSGKKKYTYGDYCTWPEDERWEIIDGEAFAMTPAPTPLHQELLVDLVAQFRTFLRGKPCRVIPSPVDVLLPKGNEGDEVVKTVVQPDLIVVCDASKIGEKRVRGAPDLAVEIISPSSVSRDVILKRRKYEKAGVREFWLVYPQDRTVMVFLRDADGVFGKPNFYPDNGKIAVSVLPGLEIDLGLAFPPRPVIVVRNHPGEYPRWEP